MTHALHRRCDPTASADLLLERVTRAPQPVENARLVSERNPFGTALVAALIRRIDAMPRSALDAEDVSCRCGCGREVPPRRCAEGNGPGAQGGRPRQYFDATCERRAKWRRTKARAAMEKGPVWM
jgi:hypothetical protein